MRKLFYSLLVLAAFSCKKEGTKLSLNQNTAFTAALKASSDSVALTPANDNDSVLTISWPAVNYSASLAVTYTLELDVPGDTSGTTPWGKAQKFVAGNNVLNYSFAGKDLNNLMQTLNFFSPAKLVFRVLSDVDQYNGSTSAIPTIYSPAIGLIVAPYLSNLWVPGAYQNWDPTTAPILNPVPGHAGLFEGYVNITGSGNQGFKYTDAPDWNHINYGDATGEVGSGTMTTDGNAGGLSVANGGYYELSANLNSNTWSTTLTTWGIIGDATPGGWNADTQLTYNATDSVWTVTCAMIQAGSYKFRANGAWNIDFGVDNAGNLVYVDNPLLTYNGPQNNLTVPADGIYKITLDLHKSQHYTYSAVKQ